MKRVLTSILALLLGVAPVSAYPIAEERKLGERFDLEARGSLPLLRDPEIVHFVSALGRKLVRRLSAPQPFDYQFRVVRDSSLNAFAVPGGFLYFHSGLLSRVGNEAELAGVMGHEITHVHAHHIVRQQAKSQLLSYAALAGMLLSVIQPALGAAALGASATVQLKYQRGFEQEADYQGVRLMAAAGYDPRGLIAFMNTIAEEQRANPVDVPPYMLSHPVTDERITNLQAILRDAEPMPGWEEPSRELLRAQTILQGLTGDRAHVTPRYAEAAETGPSARALFGLLLVHQGQHDRAVAELEKADAAGVEGLEGDLGLAYLRRGDTATALRFLRARLEAEPGDVVARAYLGLGLLQAGKYEEARDELARALREEPALVETEEHLAQSYGRSGDQARGFYHLARAYERQGVLEKAVVQYEKAAKLLPEGSPERAEAMRRKEELDEVLSERILNRRQGG